jgi:hypothetical protein
LVAQVGNRSGRCSPIPLVRDTPAIGGSGDANADKKGVSPGQAPFWRISQAGERCQPQSSQITKRSQFEPLTAMTSLKQIEANRRNAQKSTGPTTPEGKQRSRGNALRHGLTAETVIGVLESAEDYAAFEAAITAEYAPQLVIECELVARLASLLWRLRRATAIETGLLEMQADPLASFRQSVAAYSATPVRSNGELKGVVLDTGSAGVGCGPCAADCLNTGQVPFIRGKAPNLAQCFVQVASLPNFAFDRLSRYEASLWRQAGQIMFALDNLVR